MLILWYHVAVKKPNFSEERALWRQNIKYVIGIDEVGRGAFAGPIVAGAVVFPKVLRISKKNRFLKEINDSKLLKAQKRKELSKKIKKHSAFYALSEVDTQTINKVRIGRANRMVFRKVVKRIFDRIEESLKRKLRRHEYFLIADGFPTRYIKRIGLKQQKAIIDGDTKSITIAAASIIAKVHRDNLMRKLSKKYSQYKFSRNKGYGTKAHQKALKRYGLSKIHRTSFQLNKFISQ